MTDTVKIYGLRLKDQLAIKKWYHSSDIVCIKSLHDKNYKTLLYLKGDGWIYCREPDSFYVDLICTEQPGLSYLNEDQRNHFFVYEDLQRMPVQAMPWEVPPVDHT